MVARKLVELFMAKILSEIFTMEILPSICTRGWIWWFQTDRKQELWMNITMKNVSLRFFQTFVYIPASNWMQLFSA